MITCQFSGEGRTILCDPLADICSASVRPTIVQGVPTIAKFRSPISPARPARRRGNHAEDVAGLVAAVAVVVPQNLRSS